MASQPLELEHLDRDRVGHLLPHQAKRRLTHDLGRAIVVVLVGRHLGGKQDRPLRQQRDEIGQQRLNAVSRECADRVQRVELAEIGGSRDHRRDPGGAQTVDLVDHDHARRSARPQDSLGDVPIAAADRLARVQHQHHRVGVAERLVNGALHPFRQPVKRLLEAGEIGQDELVSRLGDDAKSTSASRLWPVGYGHHVLTDQSVDQRRFADVWTAGERDESRAVLAHSANRSGRSSDSNAATTCSPRRKITTISGANSASTWRQAPHGGAGWSPAWTAIDLKARAARCHRRERRDPLGATREPIRRVLDVGSGDDLTARHPQCRSDPDPRIRGVGFLTGSFGQLIQRQLVGRGRPHRRNFTGQEGKLGWRSTIVPDLWPVPSCDRR